MQSTYPEPENRTCSRIVNLFFRDDTFIINIILYHGAFYKLSDFTCYVMVTCEIYNGYGTNSTIRRSMPCLNAFSCWSGLFNINKIEFHIFFPNSEALVNCFIMQ